MVVKRWQRNLTAGQCVPISMTVKPINVMLMQVVTILMAVLHVLVAMDLLVMVLLATMLMSVHHRATTTVMKMLLAPILMDHSNAHAKTDSMIMDMIVLTSMSVE